MRVCFVGERASFEACALGRPAGGVEPFFLDHRGGLDALPAGLDPDVVVVFRPENVRAGAFDGLRALTLGFCSGDGHAEVVAGQFDRIITSSPLAGHRPEVWRSLPLPVDDALFAPVGRPAHPPQVTFLGPSTDRVEAWLVDAKHHYDVLHVASGVHGAKLRELLGRTDVALNVHGGPEPGFEHRVRAHLAAGHLVLSEPLRPLHGLEPGIDFLEMRSPGQLLSAMFGLRAFPGVHDAVRRRGRRKAENFRASRVWPRLLGDLVRDVAAFGGRRSPGGG